MPLLHRSFLVAMLCVMALGPSNLAAQAVLSDSASPTGDNDRVATPATLEELPDSRGVIWAKAQNPPEQSSPAQSSNPQSDSRNGDTQDKNEKLQRPVGTAAAEAPKVSGVTAAQPAGAAIAPAKQRRVRTLVIKIGAIAGAAAAIGIVVALSAATPSRPPGAH